MCSTSEKNRHGDREVGGAGREPLKQDGEGRLVPCRFKSAMSAYSEDLRAPETLLPGDVASS